MTRYIYFFFGLNASFCSTCTVALDSSFRGLMYSASTSSVTSLLLAWNSDTYSCSSSIASFFSSPVSSSPRL